VWDGIEDKTIDGDKMADKMRPKEKGSLMTEGLKARGSEEQDEACSEAVVTPAVRRQIFDVGSASGSPAARCCVSDVVPLDGSGQGSNRKESVGDGCDSEENGEESLPEKGAGQGEEAELGLTQVQKGPSESRRRMQPRGAALEAILDIALQECASPSIAPSSSPWRLWGVSWLGTMGCACPHHQFCPEGRGGPTALPSLLPATPVEGRKCLVLDLDETLVHAEMEDTGYPGAFPLTIMVQSTPRIVWLALRPGCAEFVAQAARLFEVVLFTSSIAAYATQVLDHIDPKGAVQHRLFREHCVNHRGNYVKDLSRLGRNLEQVIIVDNDPNAYLFHQENGLHIPSWFDDPQDRALDDTMLILHKIADKKNVLPALGRIDEILWRQDGATELNPNTTNDAT